MSYLGRIKDAGTYLLKILYIYLSNGISSRKGDGDLNRTRMVTYPIETLANKR